MPPPLEGIWLRVRGPRALDTGRYFKSPYEKFVVRDKGGHPIEAWAVSNENDKIFREIKRHCAFPEKMAYIEGMIVGIDLPIMGFCHRAIRINIEKVERIVFQ